MNSRSVIRQPAVAGSFYPADAAELQQQLTALLANTPPRHTSTSAKVLIVPHAGYIYSGATAAAAYQQLAQRRQKISRVVLLGPSHRVALTGIASPDCEQFSTPLGAINLDLSGLEQVEQIPYVAASGTGACSGTQLRSAAAIPTKPARRFFAAAASRWRNQSDASGRSY